MALCLSYITVLYFLGLVCNSSLRKKESDEGNADNFCIVFWSLGVKTIILLGFKENSTKKNTIAKVYNFDLNAKENLSQ